MKKTREHSNVRPEWDDFDNGFTWFFVDRGYAYDIFVKDEKLNAKAVFNYDHSKCIPYSLLKEFRMPVIRRKVFSGKKDLSYGNGEEVIKAFEYIKNETEYDEDMIWSDLLLKVIISDIKDNLGLNYVLGEVRAKELPEGKKIALVSYLYYEDMVRDCLKRISVLPVDVDVIILSSKDDILNIVASYITKGGMTNYSWRKVSGRGRDLGALFVECKDISLRYEYLCFVHDKKTTGGRGFSTVGESFFEMTWDNMIPSSRYVKNVIGLFEDNQRLGVLAPPIPIHGGYKVLLANGWTVNYERAVEEASRIGINVPLSRKKQPFAFSTCFWCRTVALRKMWDYGLKQEDFKAVRIRLDGELNHALERLVIYVAHDAGFYSGIVESTKWASIMQQNLYVSLRGSLKNLDKQYAKKNKKRIKRYLSGRQGIYVYGAGIEGEKARDIIEGMGFKVNAYIVSDDHYNGLNTILNPVIKLSEVPEGNIGIVIAMNKVNEGEAVENLDQSGICGAVPLFMKSKI